MEEASPRPPQRLVDRSGAGLARRREIEEPLERVEHALVRRVHARRQRAGRGEVGARLAEQPERSLGGSEEREGHGRKARLAAGAQQIERLLVAVARGAELAAIVRHHRQVGEREPLEARVPELALPRQGHEEQRLGLVEAPHREVQAPEVEQRVGLDGAVVGAPRQRERPLEQRARVLGPSFGVAHDAQVREHGGLHPRAHGAPQAAERALEGLDRARVVAADPRRCSPRRCARSRR